MKVEKFVEKFIQFEFENLFSSQNMLTLWNEWSFEKNSQMLVCYRK